MITPHELLEELGYEVSPHESDLSVSQVRKANKVLYLIDSRYEFDYVNEEAIVYLLSSEQPVLVHVPLHAPYEEYLASFERFEGFPVYFFVQGRDDGYELTKQSLLIRLQAMGMEESCTKTTVTA